MFRKRLAIAWMCVCSALLGTALAQEKIPEPPKPAGPTTAAAPSGPEQAREVRIYRLHHADAAALVKELSGVVEPKAAKLIAFPRNNSVIVVAPADMQKALEDLVLQLDVPQAQGEAAASSPPAEPRGPHSASPKAAVPAKVPPETAPSKTGTAETVFAVVRARREAQKTLEDLLASPGGMASSADQDTETRGLHVRYMKSGVLAKALEEILPAKENDEEATIIVQRVSPATQKAIEAFVRQLGGTQPATQPASNQGSGVKVFRIPSGEVASLAKALSEVSTSPGVTVQPVIVESPLLSPGTAQAAKGAGSPTETKRR